MFHTRKIAPKVTAEIYLTSTGSAGTVTRIPRPSQSHAAILIWFENGSGAKVRGRIGFSNDPMTLSAATDGDDGLGHQPAEAKEYMLPSWAQYVYVATSTANAKVFGYWLTD